MIYAIRRRADRETLVEFISRKELASATSDPTEATFRYVESGIAHRWVFDHRDHETGLHLIDGRVRYAPAAN